MKKSLLKNDFIELRAQFYTFDEIAEELGISKPTALKWAKEYKNEIEIRRLAEASNYLIGELKENERFLEVVIEQYNRFRDKDDIEKSYNRFSKKTFERISNYIGKRLESISLVIDRADEKVENVTLLFNKDLKVSLEGDPFERKKIKKITKKYTKDVD